MDLRVERPGDQEAVRAVHRRAFGAPGDDVVVALVDALRADITAEDGLSLVAEDAAGIVGHVMFTHSLLDAPRRLVEVQVLSPVGVVPERQGQGVASALLRLGIERLEERGVPLVFLEGAPGYYSRFGFVAGASQGFRKPSLRIPDAAFQVLRLSAYEPWMTGTFVYSAAFWQHDAVGLRDPEVSA